MNIMAEENAAVMAEVMKPAAALPADLPTAGPDIPALREQLAILVLPANAKKQSA